jgi:hypothetical protein
MGGRE